jgi:hypothetical protein
MRTGAEPADAAPPPSASDDGHAPTDTANDESSADPTEDVPDAGVDTDTDIIEDMDAAADRDGDVASSKTDPEVEDDTVVGGDSGDLAAPDGVSHTHTPVEDELGFAVPTWYVLFCALPFAAAFLVPITVIYRAQNSVPPMSATSAAWLGVATGWVLWLIGTAGWLLGPVVLGSARRRSPTASEWWHRTTRAWVAVAFAWGVVASLSVLAVTVLLGRLSA